MQSHYIPCNPITCITAIDGNTDSAFRWTPLTTDEAKVQLLSKLDAKEAVAKTETWTFRALAPGEVTLYLGSLRIDSPNPLRHVPTQSHDHQSPS